MRILVTTFPGEGHFQPMLPLIRAAADTGHEVVVATGPDLAPAVRDRGLTAWVAGPTLPEAFGAGAGLPPPPRDEYVFVTAGTRVFAPAGERLAADLLPRALDWRPDLVLSEVMEPAGLVVTARTGARLVVHGVGPLPEPAHWQDVPAFAALCATWGLADPLGGLLAAPYLDICPPSLHLRDHVAGQDVRPLRPAPGDETPVPGLAGQLAALPHRQTVHLTMGTIVNKQPGAFTAALAGLSGLPVNVVVGVGPGVDPAVLGPQPPNVLVLGYVPHGALLPLCTAVVSHGGAATMFGGYHAGLPHLFLPRGGDQFENAAAAARAGAALVLQPDEVSAGAVAAATRRLLAEPSFASAAGRIQAEIAAMPPAAEVLATL